MPPKRRRVDELSPSSPQVDDPENIPSSAQGNPDASQCRFPDEYDSDSAADEPALEHPSSKAIPPRKVFTSTPRNGPDSVITAASSSHPRVDHDQKEADLEKTIEVWHQIDRPTKESNLVAESTLSGSVLAMLRRGRAFARLAPDSGINAATKTSRNLARRATKRFQ